MERLICHLQDSKQIEAIGSKAANLYWLQRKRVRVPKTLVLPFEAQSTYRREGRRFVERLRSQLESLLDPNLSYAVRSSASLEDQAEHSFAGQFLSFLNVPAAQVIQAILQVLDSVRLPTVQAYLERNAISPDALQMAVIVQEYVPARISGVVFSKNPLTGLDEIVVEAVLGSGDQLVQTGVTPFRWVNRWGDWIIKPEDSPVEQNLIAQLVSRTRQIAKEYGAPVDLEWVYDGEHIYWVQLRPITHLDQVNIYSNRISREVFPGLIKPLVWSVNVPLVNSSWIVLITELIGPNDLKPEDLARSFAYRAYFNMGALGRIFTALGMPKESLELLLGMPGGGDRPRYKPSMHTWRHFPRMLGFIFHKLGYGKRVLPVLEQAKRQYDEILASPLSSLDNKALLQAIDQLYQVNRKTAYQNIVVPLLMGAYNALLRRQLAQVGVDIAHFDLTRGFTELEAYDPNVHLMRLAEQFMALDPGFQEIVRGRNYDEFTQLASNSVQLAGFQSALVRFLEKFGHLSDNGNDFSSQPWREDPDLVIRMVLELSDLSINPTAKTQHESSFEASAKNGREKLSWEDLPISITRRWILRPVYQQARQFRLYREAVSSTYTYGYGLFRVFFLELGQRLVSLGVLQSPEQIYYLSWAEARGLLEHPADKLTGSLPFDLVRQRQFEMESSRDYIMPEVIYGDQLPPLELPGAEQQTLTGIPSSRGYYRGPVKVVQRVADFDKLERGDVLVIPYSDVSWTPLFTRAGAVIAEAGGMLSHSSIVAREYNLPCVVSVSGATRLVDGTEVGVDGYRGLVTVHSDTRMS